MTFPDSAEIFAANDEAAAAVSEPGRPRSDHPLEDRILKTSINDDLFEAITRKPIRATDAEINTNPRSHSAKLRIVKPVER